MKTIKFYNIIFSTSILLLVSCSDFLGIQPKGILIPATVDEYETMLNGSRIIEGSAYYLNFITDDAFIPDLAKGSTPGVNSMAQALKNLYTFQPNVFDESENDNLWFQAYTRLYSYNTIERNILNATEGTQQKKESLRGEALTGRAFEYLTLVNAYAVHYDPKTAATDPGVPLLLDEDINKTNLTRATVQEVYDQILKDLTEAEKLLPEKPVHSVFRASKPAAWGLLARTHLYMGNYAEALKYANMVLTQTGTLLDLKLYREVNPIMYAGRINVPSDKNNPENLYIRMNFLLQGINAMVFGAEDLLKYYTEKDQRFALYFTNKPQGILNDYYLWMPYLRSNYAVFTPEIYLMAAECEARIGSKEKAMQFINTLRDHRIFDNQPLTAASNDEALVKVLEERRRELAFIGDRRLFDLKRLNKEPRFAKTITRVVNGETLTLPPNDPKYVMPIPLKVLRFNPDMISNKR